MAGVVIDTHSAIWYLADSPAMSALARQTIDEAAVNGSAIILPSISSVEIVYLTDKNKIAPETLTGLLRALKMPDSSFVTQNLTEDIAETVQYIPRSIVPDMPDRIIAATALYLNLPLVTTDNEIQTLTTIATIW